ncbi:hypothetical protein F9K33_16535 [bacterium]|nr:MAG: hypothetical protein F9K33_16535 [bacterium]
MIDITIPSQEPKLGIQKKYDKLVRQWGRELANEIMAKRASRMPIRKGKKHGGGSPILPGSFESGKRR